MLLSKIQKEFEGNLLLQIRASDEDVQKNLDDYILQLLSFVLGNHNLQEEIKTAIVNAVDRMYVSYDIIPLRGEFWKLSHPPLCLATFSDLLSPNALSQITTKHEVPAHP